MYLVSVFCCVGRVGAGQTRVVPSEGGEVVDRRGDVVAPQLVLAAAPVLPRLLLQPAVQWLSLVIIFCAFLGGNQVSLYYRQRVQFCTGGWRE